jgi:hypothetical protein
MIQNRINLKSFFITGAKPSQSNFSDFIDSCVNKADDGIDVDGNQNIVVNQGLTLKNSSVDGAVGSIRWNGTTFQFKNGSGWNDLSLGAASTQWVTLGSDINYPSGNVGIGLSASPTFKFEVELGTTISPATTVRLGNATVFADPFSAYFSHRNQANATSYALSQDTFGNVTLNTTSGKSISFFENGVVKATISGGVLSIGSPVATPGSLLVVNGNAAKAGGGAWATLSDEKLKTDISPFKQGLSLLKKLEPVNFKYNGKAGLNTNGTHVGLLAQKLEKIFPFMVSHFKAKLEESDKKETELLSIDTSALTYVMVNAIKELDEKVSKLENNQ